MLIALAALAGFLAIPATAAAGSSISAAKHQVGDLQLQIDSLNAKLAQVAAQYDTATSSYARVKAQMADNRHQLLVTAYGLALAHQHLSQAVVSTYKSGGVNTLDFLLSASSFQQLVSQIKAASALGGQDASAVVQVQQLQRQIGQRHSQLVAEQLQVEGLLGEISHQRGEISAALQQGQILLRGAQTRVQRLVTQMKARQAAARHAAAVARREAAAAAREAAAAAAARATTPAAPSPPGGGYSPSGWAQALLGDLGMPRSAQNVTAITAWEMAEGGNWFNSARYNPLDTTMPEPGSTAMNSAGVQAYTSWGQGLAATVATLTNGQYGGILAALRAGTSALAVSAAVSESPWGTGAFGV
jgi:peptidoglycan hydrolase CwlO-like protein